MVHRGRRWHAGYWSPIIRRATRAQSNHHGIVSVIVSLKLKSLRCGTVTSHVGVSHFPAVSIGVSDNCPIVCHSPSPPTAHRMPPVASLFSSPMIATLAYHWSSSCSNILITRMTRSAPKSAPQAKLSMVPPPCVPQAQHAPKNCGGRVNPSFHQWPPSKIIVALATKQRRLPIDALVQIPLQHSWQESCHRQHRLTPWELDLDACRRHYPQTFLSSGIAFIPSRSSKLPTS